MPLHTTFVNGTQILQPVIYKNIPFYASIWFYLGVLAVLIALSYTLYKFIVYRQKNRLIQKIHNPDMTFKNIIHRKFNGQIFHTESDEVTTDGEPIFYDYKFVGEYVERGLWGSVIEYDYGILEPINPRSRTSSIDSKINNVIKFLESIANTKLLTELLLSTKFKDFVITMLWVICIACVVIFLAIIVGIIISANSHPICILTPDNTTIQTIRQAVRGG